MSAASGSFDSGDLVEVTIKVRYDDRLVTGGYSFMTNTLQGVGPGKGNLVFLSDAEVLKIEHTEDLELGDVVLDAESIWWYLERRDKDGEAWEKFGTAGVYANSTVARPFLMHFRQNWETGGWDEVES